MKSSVWDTDTNNNNYSVAYSLLEPCAASITTDIFGSGFKTHRYDGKGSAKRRYTPEKVWQEHKDYILSLKKSKSSLEDIVHLLGTNKKFIVTKQQLKYKLRVWKMSNKNITSKRKQAFIAEVAQKREKLGKKTIFRNGAGGEEIRDTVVERYVKMDQNSAFDDVVASPGDIVVETPKSLMDLPLSPDSHTSIEPTQLMDFVIDNPEIQYDPPADLISTAIEHGEVEIGNYISTRSLESFNTTPDSRIGNTNEDSSAISLESNPAILQNPSKFVVVDPQAEPAEGCITTEPMECDSPDISDIINTSSSIEHECERVLKTLENLSTSCGSSPVSEGEDFGFPLGWEYREEIEKYISSKVARARRRFSRSKMKTANENMDCDFATFQTSKSSRQYSVKADVALAKIDLRGGIEKMYARRKTESSSEQRMWKGISELYGRIYEPLQNVYRNKRIGVVYWGLQVFRHVLGSKSFITANSLMMVLYRLIPAGATAEQISGPFEFAFNVLRRFDMEYDPKYLSIYENLAIFFFYQWEKAKKLQKMAIKLSEIVFQCCQDDQGARSHASLSSRASFGSLLMEYGKMRKALKIWGNPEAYVQALHSIHIELAVSNSPKEFNRLISSANTILSALRHMGEGTETIINHLHSFLIFVAGVDSQSFPQGINIGCLLSQLSEAYYYRNDYDSAITYMRAAIERWHQVANLNILFDISTAYSDLALFITRRGLVFYLVPVIERILEFRASIGKEDDAESFQLWLTLSTASFQLSGHKEQLKQLQYALMQPSALPYTC